MLPQNINDTDLGNVDVKPAFSFTQAKRTTSRIKAERGKTYVEHNKELTI